MPSTRPLLVAAGLAALGLAGTSFAAADEAQIAVAANFTAPMKAIIETFEAVMRNVSSTLSFLRVAAFGLNHVALAIAVTGCGGDSPGAQDGDIVAVHYVGTLDDGSEFDSSYEREPLEFEVGTDQVISGFDDAVHDMQVGDKKTVRIPAEDAYGPVDPDLIFPVPIDEAPDDVAIGDEVLIDGVVYGRVIAISETDVTIDTNHRFAGQALTFEIELVSITSSN